jgi:hypothetical protein
MVAVGRILTKDLTEVNALVGGAPFWGAALVFVVGVLFADKVFRE